MADETAARHPSDSGNERARNQFRGSAEERALDWLHRTQSPAFGAVSTLELVQVDPSGRFVAGIGTILSSLKVAARSVVVVVTVASGELSILPGSPTAFCWFGDRIAVVSGRRVRLWDPAEGVPAGLGEDAGTKPGLDPGLNGGRIAGLAGSDVGNQASEHVGNQAHDHSDGDGVDDRVDLGGAAEFLATSPGGGRLLAVVAVPQPDNYDASEQLLPEAGQVEPLVFTGVPEQPRRLVIVDPTAGTANVVPTDVNVWEACWLDDNRILAVASETAGETGWYHSALVVLDAATGTVTELYRPVEGVQLALPLVHDGHCLAVEAICSDRGVVAGDVVIVDPAGDIHKPTLGADVTCLTSAGIGAIGFTGLRGLETVVGLIDPDSHTGRIVWSTPETFYGSSPQVTIDAAGTFYGVLESYDRYPQLVSLRGDSVTTIVDFAHPGSVEIRRTGGVMRQISWTAPDGRTVEGLFVSPDSPGPHSLLLNVHGGPVAAWRNRWGIANHDRHPYVGLLAENGIASLYVNPRGSHGRGQEFTGLIHGDMAGADMNDLLSGIDHLIAEGLVDPAALAVTGNSYGAQMSAWLVTQTDRFAAAICTSPVVDFTTQHHSSNIPDFDRIFLDAEVESDSSAYVTRSPLRYVSRVTTPTMLTAGLMDKCTPPAQAVPFHQALRRNGVPTELVLYPRQGHGITGFPETADFLGRLLGWLERHLPAERPAMEHAGHGHRGERPRGDEHGGEAHRCSAPGGR
ncbi:S9 family peptidase [Homoserinimonas sp. OAct 916]|uniref:alpha/beta hydrolase family protein n=1 Tax=Homoserinimonas sp. OAct 916 TaxID=2211450 RepID=UPI000DBE5AD8|nr:prolyl oligopeptidase family serine peptidase [Homoserinimonas sp. OAct 916]